MNGQSSVWELAVEVLGADDEGEWGSIASGATIEPVFDRLASLPEGEAPVNVRAICAVPMLDADVAVVARLVANGQSVGQVSDEGGVTDPVNQRAPHGEIVPATYIQWNGLY